MAKQTGWSIKRTGWSKMNKISKGSIFKTSEGTILVTTGRSKPVNPPLGHSNPFFIHEIKIRHSTSAPASIGAKRFLDLDACIQLI